jgi:hypothetical protein
MTASGSSASVRPIDPIAVVLNPCRAGNPATLTTAASSSAAIDQPRFSRLSN